MDINKALVQEHGFYVDEINSGPFYTGGAASPVGLNLPVNTHYLQTTASGPKLWRKFNTGVNDWTLMLFNDFDQHVEALAETSTTSTTTFLNKITITTPTLPLGDYQVEWMLKWRAAGANRLIDIRVQRAAANIINYQPFTANVADRPVSYGYKRVVGISGIQTFTLDFKVSGSGTTVYMSDASMSFRRLK